MPSLADMLSDHDRQRLEERLAEMREVEQLVREIPAQRPPDAPPALAELADRKTLRAGTQAGRMTGMTDPPSTSPVAYASGNRAELLFAEWAQAQGWAVTRRGWPDFIWRRGGELMCVEVKDGSDYLSAWQEQTAADLAARGIPVFEWRPPSRWDPEDGQLRPVSEVQRLMTDEQVSVFTAADKALRALENARLLAEDRCRRLQNAVAARDAKLKAAAEAQADHARLEADAGYLLRHILDCRSHYVSTRVSKLMRRYRETLRADLRTLPDGGIATLEPCGTGWPA